MTLRNYFETTKGVGVLSTADTEGRVNSAVFSRPHFMDDETVAFIMNEKRSYKNIVENSHASYLFKEDSEGYVGVRLSLTKLKQERDAELIAKLSRRRYNNDQASHSKTRYLVYFRVDEQRPLIGDDE